MKEEDLNYPMLIAWIIQIAGMISLLLAIPTFLISKVLRAHPGSLILVCCIVEFFYYYMSFLLFAATLNHNQIIDFDVNAIIIPTIRTVTFHILDPNPNGQELYVYFTSLTGTALLILESYNICLSLDILLIIRNPLYSPSRRVKLYHFCSLFFPLAIILPISILMNLHSSVNSFNESISLRTKYLGFAIVFIGLIMAASLFIISCGTLIFSYIKIKKLVLNIKQKRILLWKIMIYQIFALVYSLCLIILNITIIIITIYGTETTEYMRNLLLVSVMLYIAQCYQYKICSYVRVSLWLLLLLEYYQFDFWNQEL